MKLSTFGVLAVAGMTATSVAVWAFSSSGASAESRAGGNESLTPATPVDPEPEPAIEQASFQAGSTLMMEGRLGHGVIPATTDSETYLHLNVRADSSKSATRATPLGVAIVIDRSGSMKGKRIKNALAAAQTMVERMRDGDTVSVVAYNTRTEVLVSPTVIDATSRDRVLRNLRSLRATGDTCISCGIETGMRLLSTTAGTINRILLLSDGLATAGVRDLPGFRAIADRCRQMNISISSIGVDVDYNERIMAAVARESNGRHYFVANPDGLPQVFDREMETLASTIATNAEIAIDLGPGVLLSRVFDRAFRQVGNRVIVPLGTFANTDAKTVLVQVRLPRGDAGARPIADVRLAYDDLADAKLGECDGRLIARATSDLTEVSRLDGLVSARLSRSETAAVLEEANDLFRDGRRREAQALIRGKRDELAKRRRSARSSAPASRAGELEGDFATQGGVLAAADEGFEAAIAADPAPATATGRGAGGGKAKGPAPSGAPRQQKVQIRANQQSAFDLAQ